MATINDVIFNLSQDKKELSELTKFHWNEMMSCASLKGIISFRIELMTFIDHLSNNYEQNKVRKLQKQLKRYFDFIREVEAVELNSSNYIKNILAPMKKMRAEFKSWKKHSNITKLLSERSVKLIEKDAKKQAEEAVSNAA